MCITLELDNGAAITVSRHIAGTLPSEKIEALSCLLNSIVKASGADKNIKVVRK